MKPRGKNMSKKVAVYGTLKKNHGNHPLLKDSEFLGQDRVKGWDLYAGGIPFIVKGKGSVSVEVYKIDKSTFNSIDRLEGYPEFYNRTKVSTNFGKAWIYHFDYSEDINLNKAKKIKDGNYG